MENSETEAGFFDTLIFHLFGRLIARQFVVFGGVPAALERGKELARKGMIPTYNRIDEHVRSRDHIEHILASYIALVRGMDHAVRGHVAIKPSAFGMEFGALAFARTMSRFIDAVSGRHLEIEVDAERRETLWAVQFALNLLTKKLPDGITFRPALQMHLPDDLRRELVDKYRILEMPARIVKGSGLYDVGAPELSDGEVLARYCETFRSQLALGKHPYVATVRDRKLLESIVAMTTSENVPAETFTFQFLDGPFGRSLARWYASRGYRVGCYVTFVDPSAPDEWRGYVRRRIAFGRKLFFGR